MIRYLIALVFAFAFVAGVARAEEATQKLAREYVNLPGVQKMFDDMLEPDAIAAQIAATVRTNAKIDDVKMRRISTIIHDEMTAIRPRIEKVMAETAAESFSAEELQALIDFYKSPHGSSIMAKMQPFFQKYLIELTPELQKAQRKIRLKTNEIIKSEK